MRRRALAPPRRRLRCCAVAPSVALVAAAALEVALEAFGGAVLEGAPRLPAPAPRGAAVRGAGGADGGAVEPGTTGLGFRLAV